MVNTTTPIKYSSYPKMELHPGFCNKIPPPPPPPPPPPHPTKSTLNHDEDVQKTLHTKYTQRTCASWTMAHRAQHHAHSKSFRHDPCNWGKKSKLNKCSTIGYYCTFTPPNPYQCLS